MNKSAADAVKQLRAAHRALLRATRQPLRELAASTGLAAKLSVRDRSAAVILDCATPDVPMFIGGPVGARFNLMFGSSGTVLLSGLTDPQVQNLCRRAPKAAWQLQTPVEVWERIAECRAYGFCVDPGQFHPDVHGIAAPVRDASGRLVAAVTLMGFAHDLNGATRDKHARKLLQVTSRIHVPAPQKAKR